MWMPDGHWACEVHKRIVDAPVECAACLQDLLWQARIRLDASYCEGRLVGRDWELAVKIDELLTQKKRF
jgi:hypothetical protein